MKRLIAIVLSALFTILISGQGDFVSYQFSHITPAEGLPHNMIFSITQDQQGFIWFGTNNGLARYDGYNFRVFQPDLKKEGSIHGKSVYRLHADKHGNLWIYQQGSGLEKMNLKTETFTFFSTDLDEPFNISGNIINCFYEDDDSVLWIGTNRGIDYYNNRSERFINVLNEPPVETKIGNGIQYISKDRNKNIWYLSSKGAGRILASSFKKESLGNITNQPDLDSMLLVDLLLDSHSNIWFTTELRGLFFYDTGKNQLISYLPEIQNLWNLFLDSSGILYVYADKPVNTLFIFNTETIPAKLLTQHPMYNGPNFFVEVRFDESKSGDIWISCLQGLIRYDRQSGKFHNINSKSLSGGLTDDHLNASFIDRTENLWLSILRIGVDKVDLMQKLFRWYVSDPAKINESISGNNVTAIYEDSKHNLWIGSFEAGLTCYNPLKNTFSTIKFDRNDNTKLIFNAPATIYEDASEYIWVGFYDGQVSRINPRTMKSEHFSSSLVPTSSPYYFEGWAVRKIMGDNFGNIWFATTSRGIVERKKETGQFIYHSVLYENDYTSNSLYRNMEITEDGIIWVGTQNGGLSMYDMTEKKFTQFKHDPDDTSSISSNTVYYIYEESKNILWIATSYSIDRFDRKTNTFQRFLLSSGTSSCAVYCILPDPEGLFWMSSDCGIIKFNPLNGKCDIYTNVDGMPAKEFNTTGYCLTQSNEIFMGTAKGMVSFSPDNIKPNPYKAHPILTDFKLYNKSVAPGDTIHGRVLLCEQIWSTKSIELTYTENDFTLEFSALHYAAPSKNQYYYKLEGFNKDWINVNSERRWANFTGLAPGNYKFRLQATNNDGLMCDPEDEVVLDIFIKPPFYKTWWFISILIIVSIVFVYLFIRLRINNYRKQKKLLEQMVKDRTRELEKNTIMLEEKQEEITLQNDELAKHRYELESLVKERTKQLEMAKRKAEESDRLKSAFLANMSHEIRTPMNAIVGFSGLLTEEGITDHDRIYYNDIINRNCESLLVLINDILEISKIEANQVTINKNFFDIIEIFRELENFYKMVNEKGLDIKFTEGEDRKNLIVNNDPIRYRQVLSNLLSNAYKYTEKGHIHFGFYLEDKLIKFFVSDTGIGIHKDEYEKIFSPFHKIEPFGQKLYRGTGIGLSISKSLVKLMNGKIWLESEEGKGSTFYFTVPYDDQIQDVKKTINSARGKKSKIPDLNRYKILIAEDEPTNFQLIRKIMQRVNSEVVWAQNGLEAVNFVKEHPDALIIILMDIKMPVMDGIEACEKIRELRADIPIIAVTAYAQESDMNRFLNLGFHGYVSKPLKPDRIIEAIKNIIK